MSESMCDEQEPDDLQNCGGIEIGVNPFTEPDQLCENFVFELGPTRDCSFLSRLLERKPAEWIGLDQLCDGLPTLPDGARELIDRIPNRIVLCLLEWAGAQLHSDHPTHVILAADMTSMWFQMMLTSAICRQKTTARRGWT
jgi:hypothetical protein